MKGLAVGRTIATSARLAAAEATDWRSATQTAVAHDGCVLPPSLAHEPADGG
jgi:hypothetical protein